MIGTIFLMLFINLTLGFQLRSDPVQNSSFKLTILHNNDMHARFEETTKYSTRCLPNDSEKQLCYGGFARVAHMVRKYRKEMQDGKRQVLYLNAGDSYTGTPWFTLFQDNITAAFMNVLAPDAMSLGNHEFDEGVENLASFVSKVKFPIVSANINANGTALEDALQLTKSVIIDRDGYQIGIIGYLTPDTVNITKNCGIKITNEIDAINEEAELLKSENVSIIIALGHSGYHMDQEIARNCPDVDFVIGAHSHTFLYSGEPPSSEKSEGPYPTVVKNKNGKNVPVVQAYAFTKYLGIIDLEFDSNGNLLKWDGKPILLDSSIPQDEDVLQLLDTYRPNITRLEQEVIGTTKVTLKYNNCRQEECNLGNAIADAFIYARLKQFNQNSSDSRWTDTPIAFIQGGGIRASVEKRNGGDITASDVISVLPFGSKLVVLRVPGSTLKKSLQHSADVWDDDSNGGFLQVSGLKIVYDMSKPDGERLKDVKVLCENCTVPEYVDVEDNKIYSIIMSDFLADGGDGFQFTNVLNREELPLLDREHFAQYIKDRSPLYPGIEERILLEGLSNKDPNSAFRSKLSYTLLIFSLVLIIFFS